MNLPRRVRRGRRVTAIACTALVPAVLLLGACGDDASTADDAATTASAATSTSAPSSGILNQISVEEGSSSAAAPTLHLPQVPMTVAQPEHRVLREGTGAQISADQKVVTKYLLVNARDGKPRATMWSDKPVTLPIGQIPQFESLIGQKIGSRLLLAIPASEAVGSAGDEQLDIKASDTLLYVLEPVSATAPLKTAQGTAVPPRAGVPTVTMPSKPNEPAKISVPKGDPPAETVAQPLIIGDGPRVVAGQTVRVTYTGVTWRKPGTPFDYSGKQPQGYVEFPVGTGQLIKAWDEHIVGQTVGSRLVLVVPPKDGYGSTGNPDGSITGTDTLVFVIDILDAS